MIPMRFRHLREAQLMRLAAPEESVAPDAAAAAHLAGCRRCRAAVAGARDTIARLAELPSPPTRDDALRRILARRAMGERMLLPTDPTDAPPAPRIAVRLRRLSALAAGLLIATGLYLLGGLSTRSLAAGDLDGALDVTPRLVHPGDSIHFVYRPGSILAPARALTVRARFYTAGDREPEWAAAHVIVARLTAGSDGRFHGTALLPDSVVYAQLVVEDLAGKVVDSHGGRLWEVMTADSAHAPGFLSMRQRVWALGSRDPLAALGAARELTTRFPASPEAWSLRVWYELDAAGPPARDSVKRAFHSTLARLDSSWSARAAVPDEDMGELAGLARQLDADSIAARWDGRLAVSARTGRGPAREWARLETIRDMRSADSAFASLESLWRDPGVSPDARRSMLVLAVGRLTADADSARLSLWGERILRDGTPSWRAWVSATMASTPGLRARGAKLLREMLRTLGPVTDAHRELGRSVEEQEASNRRTRGHWLGALGQVLASQRQWRAAADTLERATRQRWDASAWRILGDARLALDDTLGAADAYAHVAADPGSSPDTVTRLRTALGTHEASSRWPALVAGARRDLSRDVLVDGVHRRVRGEVRLTDEAGREHSLEEITRGSAAAVAFWSRWCTGSRQFLPGLTNATTRLAALHVPLIAVTDERPSPALRKWLDDHHVRLTIYHDVRGEARRAFAARGTPDQFVLDSAGTIRFLGGRPEDLAPRVEALRGER